MARDYQTCTLYSTARPGPRIGRAWQSAVCVFAIIASSDRAEGPSSGDALERLKWVLLLLLTLAWYAGPLRSWRRAAYVQYVLQENEVSSSACIVPLPCRLWGSVSERIQSPSVLPCTTLNRVNTVHCDIATTTTRHPGQSNCNT